MKKKLLLTTALLLLAMSVFAGMSYIGVNTGYAFTTDNFVASDGENSQYKTENKSQSVPIILDGGSYFTKNSFDIGINYGATLLSFKMPEGGTPSFNVNPYIGFSLKYNFSETFFVSGMIGTEYRNVTGMIKTTEAHAAGLSLLFDFNGGMNLFSRVMLKAGLRAGVPVFTFDNTSELKVTGFSILPYAGLSIIY